MKYVILNTSGILHVCLFSNSITHKDVATSARMSLAGAYGLAEVYSAGFVSVSTDEAKKAISCFGESDSIGVKSSPIDSKVITDFIYCANHIQFIKDYL